MAYLHNDTRTLRLHLEWVDQERQPPHRRLGTAAIEFYDRRDQEYWPMVRLPILYADPEETARFDSQLKDLCSGRVDGLSLTLGAQSELAFQAAKQADQSYLIEVGLDLAPYLQEASGKPLEPGRELALFRFHASMAAMVLFGSNSG